MPVPGWAVRSRPQPPEYAGAGALPLLYFLAAGILALAVAVETYFQNERWPILAAAVVGATVLSLVLMAITTIPAPGYAVDAATNMPVATLPPELRLLAILANVTGAFALILGAVFSTYMFMPKRRVYSRSTRTSPYDQFLFNLLIAPVAIIVSLVASLPGSRPGAHHGPHPQPGAGDDPHRDRRLHPDPDGLPEPVRGRPSCSSWASSSASCSCSWASSYRSRSSARSGSRSRRSASRPAGEGAGRERSDGPPAGAPRPAGAAVGGPR